MKENYKQTYILVDISQYNGIKHINMNYDI